MEGRCFETLPPLALLHPAGSFCVGIKGRKERNTGTRTQTESQLQEKINKKEKAKRLANSRKVTSPHFVILFTYIKDANRYSDRQTDKTDTFKSIGTQ
mmetsp:Transcript_13842/g.27571  ORF Transcript_13842/g.27571 Transcript_13842/m.27571 type:complete len:98 (-) Transcript_13842:169-462(-)